MMRLRTVIHCHTDYSWDSNRSATELVATALRQKVDCVAITDHNDIRGALAARADGRVRVIVGEEVSTADGHLIGLFLEDTIPPGLSAIETAERIRSQGGLVLAPHPFSTLCGSSLGQAMDKLLPWLDAVEVCNSQNPLPWEDRRAERFASRHELAAYVGADAHLKDYLAGCYQYLPEFRGPSEFVASLRRAELVPGRFGPGYMAAMAGQDLFSKITGARFPGFGRSSMGVEAAARAG